MRLGMQLRIPSRIKWRWLFLIAGVVFAGCGGALGASDDAAMRAQTVYMAARMRFHEQPNSIETAWMFGRACFDWADFARSDDSREEIAEEGIAACKAALRLESNSAPAHYYLALNEGQLARTKTLGALSLVRRMEAELKEAARLDRKLDYAGPDRSLGMLYLEAPGWPASIGSSKKAREHLERAEQLAPEYPENHLNLAEAYLKWNDPGGFRREIAILKELWPKAQKEFSGPSWESSWDGWEPRWRALQAKAAAMDRKD